MDRFMRLVCGYIGAATVTLAVLLLIDGVFWTHVSPRVLIIVPALIALAVGGVLVLAAVLTGDRTLRTRL